MRVLVAIVGAIVVGAVGCTGVEPDIESSEQALVRRDLGADASATFGGRSATTREAREILDRVRGHHPTDECDLDAGVVCSGPGHERVPDSETRGIDIGTDRSRTPKFDRAPPVNVTLPERAEGEVSLHDVASNMRISFRLEGAQSRIAEQVDGYDVYVADRNGGPSVVHRAKPEGTEEYVTLDAPPAGQALRYAVRLTRGVAGLRLIEGNVEFLDRGGVPHLKMRRPTSWPTHDERLDLPASIEGCAYDTDPTGPWGRRPVDPGANVCTIAERQLHLPNDDNYISPSAAA